MRRNLQIWKIGDSVKSRREKEQPMAGLVQKKSGLVEMVYDYDVHTAPCKQNPDNAKAVLS